MRMYKAK